jgi:hypothetical protein
LDEWALAYNFRRNEVQDYYAMAEIPEIESQIADSCRQLGLRYALTGFSSAARIAPMVRYQKASVYLQGDIPSMAQTLGWKGVQSGANISLLVPYDDGVFYGAKDQDEITSHLLCKLTWIYKIIVDVARRRLRQFEGRWKNHGSNTKRCWRHDSGLLPLCPFPGASASDNPIRPGRTVVHMRLFLGESRGSL